MVCGTAWSDPASRQSHLPSTLWSWLTDRDSLTERLERRARQVSVELLSSDWCPTDSSCCQLPDEPVLRREVLLHCDGKPWVYACSLIPESTLRGAELADLGDEPLGRRLFSDAAMRRGPIQIAEFPADGELAWLNRHLPDPIEHNLWGRRSLFHLNHCPLLVTEVFLPLAAAYDDTPIEV